MFTSFSSPLLESLFTPPHGTWLWAEFFYERVVLILLVVLLVAPLPLAGISAGAVFLPKYRHKSKVKRSQNGWKPWAFSHIYLLLMNYTTLCFIVLVLFLNWRSKQPDSLVERMSLISLISQVGIRY